jgi:hypothetical protein
MFPRFKERVALGRVRGFRDAMRERAVWGILSMNLLAPRKPLTPSLSPSDGERVAAGRVRG